MREFNAAAATDQDCPICSEALIAAKGEEQQAVVGLEICGHQFHQVCIMAWINPIIPPYKTRKIDSAALLFEKATRADIPPMHSLPVITSHPDYQKLFKIDLMRHQGLLKHPTSGDIAAAKKNCPMCRKAIFTFNLEHTDSLELMQVRLRLTNLAYQVCGFRRTGREHTDRIALQQFLAWRWAEETSCKQDGTVVSMPGWADCVRLFKLARLSLRDEAWRYMRDYILLASEQMRVLQLITFFENIKLRSDLVAAFFMLDPTLNQDWVFNQTTERFHHLTTDPVSFAQVFGSELLRSQIFLVGT